MSKGTKFFLSLAIILFGIGQLRQASQIRALQDKLAVLSEFRPPFTNIKSNADQTIAWAGHPMTSDNDPDFPRQGWLPHCLIGLRSDGLVVWKGVTNAP